MATRASAQDGGLPSAGPDAADTLTSTTAGVNGAAVSHKGHATEERDIDDADAPPLTEGEACISLVRIGVATSRNDMEAEFHAFNTNKDPHLDKAELRKWLAARLDRPPTQEELVVNTCLPTWLAALHAAVHSSTPTTCPPGQAYWAFIRLNGNSLIGVAR